MQNKTMISKVVKNSDARVLFKILGEVKVMKKEFSLSEIEIQFAASCSAEHQSILIRISPKMCVCKYISALFDRNRLVHSTAFWENIGTTCLKFRQKSLPRLTMSVSMHIDICRTNAEICEKISPKIV